MRGLLRQWRALNPEQELLGISRLVEVLADRRPDTTRAACAAVIETVEAFAAGAEQSDDLTVLAIRHTAPVSRRED